MLRDATAIFIAGYCIFLLFAMCAARHSPVEFAAHYAKWGSGLSKILHLLALIAAVYHSVTFFNLTPQVLVVFRGEEKVPGHLIAAGHYVLWAVVSLIIIWIGLKL
jgi:fumarate reductase subunit C